MMLKQLLYAVYAYSSICSGKPKPGDLTSDFFGGANPPDERKEGKPMYVTYQDLVQIGIFIVALVSLLYQIFKGRK